MSHPPSDDTPQEPDLFPANNRQGAPVTLFDPSKIERHMSRSRSRAQAVLDIVERLTAANLAPISGIREAVARKQHHQAAHMLHTLRGSVANLGGSRVCDLANDLEHLLDQNLNAPLLDEWINCLEREFVLFLQSAQRWLQQQRAHHGTLDMQPGSGAPARLTELKTCLQEHNLRAFELFETLQWHLRESWSDHVFDEFSEALTQLDFERALRCMTPLYQAAP